MRSFQRFLLAVLAEGKKRGYETRVVFPNAAAESEWIGEFDRVADAITFTRVDDPRSERAAVLRALLPTTEPTILHSHFAAYDIPAVRAARDLRHVKTVWHMHSALSRSPKVVLRNVVKLAWLGRGVDCLLCSSEQVAKETQRRGAPAGRIAVFPNAIAATEFPLLVPEYRESIRRSFPVPEGALILLHFGWDWRLKGGELFVRTVKSLAERGVPVFGLSQGDADRSSRKLAHRLEISGLVRSINSAGRVQDLYALADVFVASSLVEGMPYSVLEALCSGTAVVATNIPGHAAAGADVPNLKLVDPDPDAFADAIEILRARTLDHAGEDSLKSRDLIRSRFDIADSASLLVDRYEALLDVDRGGTRSPARRDGGRPR